MEPSPFHTLVNQNRTAYTRTPVRGFTLVELVVVLAIIVTITVIALLGQSTFNQSLLLTDTTYTIAFSVRQAQTLGLSTRQFVDGSGGITTNPGYGIHIDIKKPSLYVMYADIVPAAGNGAFNQLLGMCPGHVAPAGDPDAKPGNCLYNSTTELVQQYILNRGFKLSRICGMKADGTYICSDSVNGPTLDSVDIEFMRPSTQSVILGTQSDTGLLTLSSAIIYVKPSSGQTERCIYVSQLGQIAVNYKGDTNCP